MLNLVAIEPKFDITFIDDETLKAVLEDTLNYYQVIGFNLPWVSYLAEYNGEFVGICSFKGKPVKGRVEIAYFTFPLYECKGFGTSMCQGLLQIAKAEQVMAMTLPIENASTKILKKSGFVFNRAITDPEEGEFYEWLLP